jgi:general secretion pathway protein B
MSLILDALRKSEAERRRGQAPTLYSSLPSPGTQRRAWWQNPLPWVGAGVLLLVALFFYFRSDEPATKAELAQETPGESAGADVSTSAIDSSTAVPVLAPAPPPRSAARPAAATTREAPARAPTVDALVKAPAPTLSNPPGSIAATSPAPETSVEPAPATEEDLPPLAVLDPGARGALPPLKLSMHVYDSDPAKRFAIIDGQRVTEGSQLGAAVVTEIRRDGVVLDVDGRRVIVPRP